MSSKRSGGKLLLLVVIKINKEINEYCDLKYKIVDSLFYALFELSRFFARKVGDFNK